MRMRSIVDSLPPEITAATSFRADANTGEHPALLDSGCEESFFVGFPALLMRQCWLGSCTSVRSGSVTLPEKPALAGRSLESIGRNETVLWRDDRADCTLART